MASYLNSAHAAPLSQHMEYDAGDTDDPGKYKYLAYHHPDSPETYFAVESFGETDTIGGEVQHMGLVSPINELAMPCLPDSEVWAISKNEYDRIVVLEWRWWEDYKRHIAENQDHQGAVDFANAEVSKQGR